MLVVAAFIAAADEGPRVGGGVVYGHDELRCAADEMVWVESYTYATETSTNYRTPRESIADSFPELDASAFEVVHGSSTTIHLYDGEQWVRLSNGAGYRVELSAGCADTPIEVTGT